MKYFPGYGKKWPFYWETWNSQYGSNNNKCSSFMLWIEKRKWKLYLYLFFVLPFENVTEHEEKKWRIGQKSFTRISRQNEWWKQTTSTQKIRNERMNEWTKDWLIDWVNIYAFNQEEPFGKLLLLFCWNVKSIEHTVSLPVTNSRLFPFLILLFLLFW